MQNRIIAGIGIIIALILLFKFCEFKKGDDSTIDYRAFAFKNF